MKKCSSQNEIELISSKSYAMRDSINQNIDYSSLIQSEKIEMKLVKEILKEFLSQDSKIEGTQQE